MFIVCKVYHDDKETVKQEFALVGFSNESEGVLMNGRNAGEQSLEDFFSHISLEVLGDEYKVTVEKK